MTPSTTSASVWLRVTATVLLLLLLSACASCGRNEHVVIIRPAEEIVHLEAGIPAPYAGWLLTDAQIIEIYAALGRELK